MNGFSKIYGKELAWLPEVCREPCCLTGNPGIPDGGA